MNLYPPLTILRILTRCVRLLVSKKQWFVEERYCSYSLLRDVSKKCGLICATLLAFTFSFGQVTVTGNNNPSCQGSNVTLTATLNPASATGTVTFFDGGSALGSAVNIVAGSASINISTLTPGTHSITAQYSGDGINLPSTSGPYSHVVTANGTINVSSAIGSESPTLCKNSPLTNITFAVGGSATGATISAGSLPAGLSTSFSGGVFTISGNPTVAGTFNYTVSTTGSPCNNPSISGIITVTDLGTISLSGGSASSTLCVSTALTNISYAIGGNATGANVSGLPTGVTGNYNSGVFTISGTPSTTGTFNYTVTTSGSPCLNPSLTGTITVTPNGSISLTSGNATQTLCVNSPITNITYNVAGTATGANVTGLPAGVTGTFNAGVFTISGTPTASGTFNFTVTTTGAPCVNPSLSGTITVNAVPTVTTANTATICSQTATAINLTASVPSNFTWTVGTITGGITGASNGSGSTIAQTLTNPGSTSGSVEYIVTPTSTTGSCAGSPYTITVTVSPRPSIVNQTPAAICSGAGVNLNSGDFTGTNNIPAGTTYSWPAPAVAGVTGLAAGTDQAGFSTGALTNTTTSPVTVTYVVTPKSGNCTGTPFNITFTLNPTVIPSVLINASPGSTICAGTSVTFTATPTNGGTNPSYQWKVNGVDVGTNSPTFSSNSLVNTDKVTVVMTTNAICPSSPTVTSNQITMTVNDLVVPSVTVAPSATTICPGTSVTFTATPVNGGSAPSYQWRVNGTNAGTNSPTFTTSTLNNNDVVTVVLTSNAVCATPTTATSAGITMTVTPAPVPSVAISASTTSICPGGSVTFTATPTNGGPAPTYQWRVNGTNVGTNSPTFTTTTLNNNDNVTVVMTSNAPCASPVSATSNAIPITVVPAPVPSVTVSASATTICPGGSITFTANPVNGGTTPSYQWKVNGTNVGTDSPTFTTTSLNNGDNVSVVLTSNAPCASPTTATSANTTITVNPAAPAAPAAITGAAEACR